MSPTRLIVFLGLLYPMSLGTARAQDLVFEATLHGELTATGNTLGLDSTLSAGVANPGINGGIGAFIANPLLASGDTSGNFPVGTTSDWQRNGSSAFLELGDIDVEHAELVWACSTAVGGQPSPALLTPDTATLTLPDGDAFPIEPDAERNNLNLLNAGYSYYQRWADVTDLVREGGEGLYTVSAVVGSARADANYLTGCGWTLVVVKTANELPLRNINLWVAGTEIRATGVNGQGTACPCNVEIFLDGFCTPALPAAPTGRMIVSAMEGDVRFVGDTMSIAQPNGANAFIPLAGPNNPSNNFFASQINGPDGQLDNRGTFGDSNHTVDPDDGASFTRLPGARQGWDITRIPLNDDTYNTGTLTHNQTSTRFRITTTQNGDDYILSIVGMELEVASPLIISEHVMDRDITFIGDTVRATVTFTNEGNGPADDVAFCYDVPGNATLVSVSIDGEAVPGVTAADIAPEKCETGEGLMIGEMVVGASRRMVVELRVDRIDPKPAGFDRLSGTESWRTEWTPRCRATSTQVDEQTGTTVSVGAPLLRVSLSVEPTGSARGGDVLTYGITVTNVGTGPSSDTTVTATIPNGTTYVEGSTSLNGASLADLGGGQNPFANGREVQSPGAPAGVIVPDGTATVRYEVRVNEPTTTDETEIRHTVRADPDGEEGPIDELTSNEVFTLVEGLIPPEPEPEPEPEPQPEPEPEPQPEVDPCAVDPNVCYLSEGGACQGGGLSFAALGLAIGILALRRLSHRGPRAS